MVFILIFRMEASKKSVDDAAIRLEKRLLKFGQSSTTNNGSTKTTTTTSANVAQVITAA